ncbi:zinc finger protein 41-like [Pectinophora gossypiella]|nr:zinc finger protein 41-like [Pectinophora gossypiella]
MDSTTRNRINNSQLANICCCCLTDGCYKNISTDYYFSGLKEVYEDMLKDTFNLQINIENRVASRLICDDCIRKLREASAFKDMVLQSLETLGQYMDRLKNETKMEELPEPEIKSEEIKVEKLQVVGTDVRCDDQNYDNDANDTSMDDDEALANIKSELNRTDKVILSAKRRRKQLRERNVRKRAKIKENGGPGDIKDKSKTEKDWLKIAERRGNGPLLRENSLKLLANSTICVFQWNKSRYRCFCCKEPFSDMNLLREHTHSQHSLENIEKKIIVQQNRLVKVEISVLYCKICGNQMDNLTNLRNHLRSHNIKFELDEDLLVPFKIGVGNLQCQICAQNFTMFRLLNMHMNKHYQKQVCHICGAGFSNLVFLNLHKTRSHRPLACKECDLVFKNKIDKKDHDVKVHNLKIEKKLRFPCPYCQDRFSQENFRVQHLVEKHGMLRPEHKCGMCSKVFITKSLCNNHVKNVHLKEKNHECDVCHHFFYTKSDVSRHRVTHTGEKLSCSLCNNLFASKDSLRRHMKRTHVGSQ